jgi:hypothetical protein
MRVSIEHDRQAQLLLGADPALGYDDARWRLERAALVVSAAGAARTPWGQAALLTIAECATRMFRGGVYLGREFCEPVVVGTARPCRFNLCWLRPAAATRSLRRMSSPCMWAPTRPHLKELLAAGPMDGLLRSHRARPRIGRWRETKSAVHSLAR